MSDAERLLPFCQPDQFTLLPLVSRWCGAHSRTLDYCRNEAAEALLAEHAAPQPDTASLAALLVAAMGRGVWDYQMADDLAARLVAAGVTLVPTPPDALDVERLHLALRKWIGATRPFPTLMDDAEFIAREYAAQPKEADR